MEPTPTCPTRTARLLANWHRKQTVQTLCTCSNNTVQSKHLASHSGSPTAALTNCSSCLSCVSVAALSNTACCSCTGSSEARSRLSSPFVFCSGLEQNGNKCVFVMLPGDMQRRTIVFFNLIDIGSLVQQQLNQRHVLSQHNGSGER
jgi:hypothetical protein